MMPPTIVWLPAERTEELGLGFAPRALFIASRGMAGASQYPDTSLLTIFFLHLLFFLHPFFFKQSTVYPEAQLCSTAEPISQSHHSLLLLITQVILCNNYKRIFRGSSHLENEREMVGRRQGICEEVYLACSS